MLSFHQPSTFDFAILKINACLATFVSKLEFMNILNLKSFFCMIFHLYLVTTHCDYTLLKHNRMQKHKRFLSINASIVMSRNKKTDVANIVLATYVRKLNINRN